MGGDSTFLLKTLESISGKTAVECLVLFRHLMVDVMVASTFGYRLGALAKWAMGIEVPLSTAINDFPKRGILVHPSVEILTIQLLTISAAEHRPSLGLESRLSHSKSAVETNV